MLVQRTVTKSDSFQAGPKSVKLYIDLWTGIGIFLNPSWKQTNKQKKFE